MFENAIDLTSFDRVRYHLELKGTNVDTKRTVLDWISTVSARVQDFLQRDLLIKSRTEYFDVRENQIVFPVTSYPIIPPITSIQTDSLGLFDSYIDQQNFFPSKDGDALVLGYPVLPGFRALRATYTGGLTYHATQSIYTLTSVTALELLHYVEGQSSGAVGRVRKKTGNDVTVEVLMGRFQEGEDLLAYTSEDLGNSKVSGFSATLTTVTRRCLAEAHPLIVKAVEIEIRYMRTHKLDFENESSGKEGTRRRVDTTKDISYELQRESEALLTRYRRIPI